MAVPRPVPEGSETQSQAHLKQTDVAAGLALVEDRLGQNQAVVDEVVVLVSRIDGPMAGGRRGLQRVGRLQPGGEYPGIAAAAPEALRAHGDPCRRGEDDGYAAGGEVPGRGG